MDGGIRGGTRLWKLRGGRSREQGGFTLDAPAARSMPGSNSFTSAGKTECRADGYK
jgi:hypothetical protein